MENVFNADQMKDVAFNACCRNLGFCALLSTTIDFVKERADQGFMTAEISVEDYPVLEEKKYRDVFKTHLKSLGFNTEDVVRITGGELVLNCVKVSWYVSN